MEHLALPSQGLPAEFQFVPWLGGTYDRGDFTSWPKRNQRPEVTYQFCHTRDTPVAVDTVPFRDVKGGLLKPVLKAEYVGVYAYSLERLIQDWLLFGLLWAFFGESFDESDFTRYSDPQSETILIDTARLDSLIHHWHQAKTILSGSQIRYLEGCLCDAFWVLRDLLDNSSFDRRLALSTFTVMEHLDRALQVVEKTSQPLRPLISDLQRYPRIFTHVGEKVVMKCFRVFMSENNWCPENAAVVLNHCTSTSACCFLSCLKKPDSGSRHHRCSEKYCVRARAEYEQLRSECATHRYDCRGCTEQGPRLHSCVLPRRLANVTYVLCP